MVKIKFYGALKKFGSEFNLDVKDTAEAMRALTIQIPGLRAFFNSGMFRVRIGKQYIDSRYVEKGLFYKLKDGMMVHFTPIVGGAKRAGVFSIIAGVVLMIVSIWTGGYTFAMGLSMVIGGISQALTKMPDMPGKGNDVAKKQSTSFSNLSNMAAQGRPVPLAYGRIRTGSLIISQGVETIDVEVDNQGNNTRNHTFTNGRNSFVSVGG